ncbi:HsdM family class I SAM-dependent methyltransferase [Methanosarcina sp.]|uniref:HsdM family class I SAM-dependent methyltransferase n=1 Tax=Methanosarcina sp. TaxID=2213 RepID=UPI003BB61212
MANERITEDIVRDHFKNDPLIDVITLEEQKSKSQRVNGLLKTASKTGKSTKGMPEFLITFPSQNINYIIVIECKASVGNHESANRNKPKEYAVDGVLHYSKSLSKDYDVIALAVSGETKEEIKVSTFKWAKGNSTEHDLNENKLLLISDYIKLFNNEIFTENLKNVDIVQKAIHLNEEFHSYSITENGRCTVVSAILLSLLDEPFKNSYATYTDTTDLADEMLRALKRVLTHKRVRNPDSMIKEFNKILNEPVFKQKQINKNINKSKIKKDTIQVVKEDFIDYLYKNVYPLVKMDDVGFDVLGKFYTEFIRYAGSSQKQGLVLTPAHVTDLFCDLSDINVDSVVYDPCCGSGGFLIAAMKRMITLAGADSEKRKNIQYNQLVGVERRADMFSYACTNMMFRGDGKSNIYNDDCFNVEATIIKNHSPNVVLLNPPYDVGNVGQMRFIEHALNAVSKTNGIVVAIVQMSCAIKNDKSLISIKEKLLKQHRLKAVISMPEDVFYPVGVVTCSMVWEANVPNKGYETWFGYLKDDGFEKRKHRGRLDFKKKWNEIRNNFVQAYKNSREIVGLSVKTEITAKDEWCAEAYMETDYSTLKEEDFEIELKKYILFKEWN